MLRAAVIVFLFPFLTSYAGGEAGTTLLMGNNVFPPSSSSGRTTTSSSLNMRCAPGLRDPPINDARRFAHRSMCAFSRPESCISNTDAW
jgi:hypothetical protein